MASLGLQILGVALSFVGLLGSIITCALPMWRVTAFIGNNIVTAQIIWEGLWMICVPQSTGHMQCNVYDSTLALSTDLQAARAFVFVGGKCTTCIQNKTSKARVVISAGVFFIISGLLCLYLFSTCLILHSSWSAKSFSLATIITYPLCKASAQNSSCGMVNRGVFTQC
uniref:Claudin n=1 Tax=Cyprinus carpio TaxID=7962 RepID=A0A8C1LIL2_CYPCA